jgi:uncharacterized iron-regulated membrane protein
LKLRRALFWLHLAAGVCVGAVVLAMSLTGALLALQRPVLAIAERGLRIAVPAGTERLSLDALALEAEGAPDGAVLRAEPTAPVALTYGRGRTLYFDPYTGASLGEGAKGARSFFRSVEDFHRWLGFPEKRRALGRGITGAANAGFFLLALSGLFLWWPRRWTRAALKAVLLPSLKGHGKARDWNWHNSIGAWSAPVLLLITMTGLVMSYSWANDLLYKAAGDAPPPRARRADAPSPDKSGGQERAPVAFEALAAAARKRAPDWTSITLRLPRAGTEATALIETAGSPYSLRSTLILDAATAAVIKWEPASGWSRGRRLRTLARFTHTGETGGAAGQAAAALASIGGTILVCTGFALAWRRLRAFRARNDNGGRA